MSKHTPGPWHRNIPPASKYPTVWSGRNTHVAAISPGAHRRSGNGCTMSEEEQEANINLIAAAPEMLAALKVAECFKRLGYTQQAVRALEAEGITIPLVPPFGNDLANYATEQMRAAIAKAEGRQ